MKKIIIPIIIVIIIILLFLIGNAVFNSVLISDGDSNNYEQSIINTNGNITGKGSITSFNIEELDTGYWTSVDEVYVKDGDLVESNQKILKVSNSEATGVIYSTIKGKFFIDESKESSKKYYIYDLDNVGFEIEVNEEYSSNLKIGQKVNVNINSLSESITGKVYYISKISNDGIIKVKIKLDYSDDIKFGYTAKAEILINDEVDTSVQEFDTKNSFMKIGKTAITYKNSNNQVVETPIIEDFTEIEEPTITEEFSNDSESYDEIEYDIGGALEYYNEYWNEYWNNYWNNYWKTYYETGEPIPDIND
jgi:hypothetical protein